MFDLLLGLVSSFVGDAWGSLVLYGGMALAVVGGFVTSYMKGRGDMKKKQEVENLKGRLQSIEAMKEKKRDAEIQTDEALADRISRKR